MAQPPPAELQEKGLSSPSNRERSEFSQKSLIYHFAEI